MDKNINFNYLFCLIFSLWDTKNYFCTFLLISGVLRRKCTHLPDKIKLCCKKRRLRKDDISSDQRRQWCHSLEWNTGTGGSDAKYRTEPHRGRDPRARLRQVFLHTRSEPVPVVLYTLYTKLIWCVFKLTLLICMGTKTDVLLTDRFSEWVQRPNS